MKKLTETKKSGTKFAKSSIKGKQALVGGLVVLVAVAGYYRWSTGQGEDKTAKGEPTVTVMSTAKVQKDDYFVKSREERDNVRSESDAKLEKITESDDATADSKADAREKIKKSAENIKLEGEVEGLIKSKGYDECLVYIDEEEIRIIVKADKIDEDKVAQITDIVTSKTDFKPSQIIISNHE